MPSQAECRRVRERALRILTEAQMLCERLDQTGGLLGLALQAQAGAAEFAPRPMATSSRLQFSLA